MYIRSVKTKNLSKDKEYVNFKLVQNIRIGGGEPRQKIILSLGNLSHLVKYSFSKQAMIKIRKENIDDEILDKLNGLGGEKYCNTFHLQHALDKTIGKEYQKNTFR